MSTIQLTTTAGDPVEIDPASIECLLPLVDCTAVCLIPDTDHRVIEDVAEINDRLQAAGSPISFDPDGERTIL